MQRYQEILNRNCRNTKKLRAASTDEPAHQDSTPQLLQISINRVPESNQYWALYNWFIESRYFYTLTVKTEDDIRFEQLRIVGVRQTRTFEIHVESLRIPFPKVPE